MVEIDGDEGIHDVTVKLNIGNVLDQRAAEGLSRKRGKARLKSKDLIGRHILRITVVDEVNFNLSLWIDGEDFCTIPRRISRILSHTVRPNFNQGLKMITVVEIGNFRHQTLKPIAVRHKLTVELIRCIVECYVHWVGVAGLQLNRWDDILNSHFGRSLRNLALNWRHEPGVKELGGHIFSLVAHFNLPDILHLTNKFH